MGKETVTIYLAKGINYVRGIMDSLPCSPSQHNQHEEKTAQCIFAAVSLYRPLLTLKGWNNSKYGKKPKTTQSYLN